MMTSRTTRRALMARGIGTRLSECPGRSFGRLSHDRQRPQVVGHYWRCMVSIPVQILDEAATLPGYARLNDAGADLVSIEAAEIPAGGGRAMVRTGVAIAIPPGYAGFVQPRSGLAAKYGVTVLNSPGLIDAGY